MMFAFPPSFWTEEELKDIPDSDISAEIADTCIIDSPECDAYLNRLIAELQRRDKISTESVS
jgi:hypothetical protein